MEKDEYVEKLLNDFVFLDCRLGSHPKVRAQLYWKQGEDFVLYECSPHNARIMPNGHLILHPSERLVDNIFWGGTYYIFLKNVVEAHRPGLYEEHRMGSWASILAVPLKDVEQLYGVLSIGSIEKAYFKEEHIGSAQLLGALLVYARMRSWMGGIMTSASIALGRALKRVREEVGLSQSELASKLHQSRIALSRWESGAQPPSIGPLYEWCEALGLVSSTSGAHVTVVDITARLLKLIQENPEHLRELSPSQFEQFVAGRLDRMGFDATLTGATSHKDGGIDLIAVPKIRTVGSFLLAGQVKHHRGNQKTGRDAVDRLLAWKDSHFRLGLLVTNTAFTEDAQWVASQVTNRAFIRLRDFEDLKRWIEDNFWSEEDWQEIPDQVSLAPGVTIVIPKPRLPNSLEIWPLSRLDPKDIKYGQGKR